MKPSPHPHSDDLGRLAWGCAWASLILATIALAAISSCRPAVAQTPTAVYLPIVHVPYPPIGIAWHSGTAQDLETLNARYHYACCSDCPAAGSAKIPMLRPGEWWADCPADYDGHIFIGNEGEFCTGGDCLTPSQMAQFIIASRAELPQAIFVCLNSYSISYMLDVIALLPPDICQIWGVHVYDDVDISSHLDGLCTDCAIWITEVGACGSNAEQRMYEQVTQALWDGRVGRVFGYTGRGAQPQCLNMLTAEGELRPSGAGFVAAVQGYP